MHYFLELIALLLFFSWTLEVVRPEVLHSTSHSLQPTELPSPSGSFILPSWARSQAEAYAELSTSDPSDEGSPIHPAAEIFFDVSAEVVHVSTSDDCSSSG